MILKTIALLTSGVFSVVNGLSSDVKSTFSVPPGCPLYDDIANISNSALLSFDFDKFKADDGWYEVASRNLPIATYGCMCTHYDYTHEEGSDQWYEHFQCRKGSKDSEPVRMTSEGYLSTVEERPGEMTASVGGAPVAEYWVLDVVDEKGDYSDALLYACIDVNDIKQEYIYIFRRIPEINSAVLDKWVVDLGAKGVNVTGVKPIEQEGCW